MKNDLKMRIYRDLWVLTGFLLGTLFGGFIEIAILQRETIEYPIYYIYLPAMFAGVLFGFWAGPVAWRKIYIEGARGKKYVIKK